MKLPARARHPSSTPAASRVLRDDTSIEAMHTFTFTWDRATHVRACRAVVKHGDRGWGSRLLRWSMVGVAVICLLTIAITPPDRVPDLLWEIMPVILAVALWLVFFRIGLPRLQAWNHARNSPDVAHPMVGKLDEEGFGITCFSGSSAVRWKGMRKVVETPEVFLFYFTPQCALYLPKNAVPGASALDEVRREIAFRFGERARLLPAAAPARA